MRREWDDQLGPKAIIGIFSIWFVFVLGLGLAWIAFVVWAIYRLVMWLTSQTL